MIICQTLWTNQKNLTSDSFGWISPQYHLMAWALSCLKLSKQYKSVHLYTDKSGKEMLVDYLELPYELISEDYNDIACQSNLWALPKLMTYAKQNQPFLHVDGDVMVWQPFTKALLSGELIAQNLEKGTDYYKQKFEPILNGLHYIPDILKHNLKSAEMYAYNAGIIGGSNTDFFKKLAYLAKQFIERNKNSKLNSSFNIIFEQLLFYSLAKKENRKVNCLKDELINDNGYDQKRFANFPLVEKNGYLHLIGPHKSNKEVCNWLGRYLLQENKEVFLKIAALFKEQYFFYNTKVKEVYQTALDSVSRPFKYVKTKWFIGFLDSDVIVSSTLELTDYVAKSENFFLKELYKYEQRVKKILSKFSKINSYSLAKLDEDVMISTAFLKVSEEKRQAFTVSINPYMETVHSAFDWTSMRVLAADSHYIKNSSKKDLVIAVIPDLFFGGYQEVLLDELCVNIIILIETSSSYRDLLNKLHDFFPEKERDNQDFYELILLKVEFLISNKVIFLVE